MSRRRQVSLAHYNVDPQHFAQVRVDADLSISLRTAKDVSGFTPLDHPVPVVPGSQCRVVGVCDSMPQSSFEHWLGLGIRSDLPERDRASTA